MHPMSAKARAVTRNAFLATLVILTVEIGIGVAVWPSEPWHGPVAAAVFTTYLFVAIFGILLAGAWWPALGDFIQLHTWVVIGFVMGSAAALLGFVAFPDPVMLIIGPLVLGFFVLMGWGVQKGREFLGF